MKKKLLQLLRTLLGLLFLFSGFVKCVDPMGGAIKIEDYFVAWGLDFIPFGVDMCLSMLQNIVELTVGFMLLTNVFTGVASFFALAFMVFYTPLTLYIAIENPVSDCGCFGDAVKLTNWETFGKNMVFLPIAVFVFMKHKWAKSHLSTWRQVAVLCMGLMVASLISIKGVTDEPIIDFRPYAVGVDINKAMSIPEDAPMPEYKSTFILEKNGERREFDELNYPYEDSTWVYIDTRTEVVSEGYVPPIKDFTLTDKYGEVQTGRILSSHDPVVLVVSPSTEDISTEHVAMLSKIAETQYASNHEMYILTASGQSEQDNLDRRAERGFDYLQADETMLKTMMRSNPGIMVVQDGIVIAKYHVDHLPSQMLDAPLATKLSNIEAENVRLTNLCIIFAVVLMLVIIAKRKRREEPTGFDQKTM